MKSPGFFYILTVILTPWPVCIENFGGARPPETFGQCMAFHPFFYFLNSNLTIYGGRYIHLTERILFILITYFINAIYFLPVLIIFLITQKYFSSKKIGEKILWWILILGVYWLIIYYYSTFRPYGREEDPLGLFAGIFYLSKIYPTWTIN